MDRESHPTAFGLIEAEGHGPIPARTLAALLTDHGQRALWRAQILDDRPHSPTHGSIIGIGATATHPGYTPSLKALVRARSHRCTFPGCRRPATTCDLDHVVPYADGGTTSEDNLHPLCRFHHLLKHHAGSPPNTTPTRAPSPGAPPPDTT